MGLINLTIEGRIAKITLNRAEAGNASGRHGAGAEIRTMCEEINQIREIRCAALTGAGKIFSAGVDIKAMKERAGAFAADGVAIREGCRRNIHEVAKSFTNLDVPLIAAVNGTAIGLGCDVACLADVRLASDRAIFGSNFLKLGLVPGEGGAWLLPRIIGMSRAPELFYTGQTIDADIAASWGRVSRVTPHEKLLEEAQALAESICTQPPHALCFTKSLLRQGQSGSFEKIMEMSAALQAVAHLTEDHMEGVDALIEKRSPDFQGRYAEENDGTS